MKTRQIHGLGLGEFLIFAPAKEMLKSAYFFSALMISGVFFGLMFGLGGVGSAFFGWLADRTSVEYIFLVSSFSPLLGIVAGLLPNTQKKAVSQQ